MHKQIKKQRQEDYKIYIGGRSFNITSSSGEKHIRRVENKLSETIGEITDSLNLPFSQQTALLAALNLADELVEITVEDVNKQEEMEKRINVLIGDLDKVL